ncbi:MAG: hypothetical protein IPM24_01225 [Bryobacterales bacterium]|nr:hypothetical protein [Bryobacterales bacterium]
MSGTPKIFATGAGVISPIGAGVDEFAERLYAGCRGAGPSPLLGGDAVACEIRDFTPQQWLGNKGIRVLDRSARLLAVASQMTLSATGLVQPETGEGDPGLGLVCGTMFGSVHSITSFDWSGLTDGPRYVNPMEFPNTVINSPAGQAAIKFKLRGVNSTISAGLISGLYAVHYASEFLIFGRATALLAGGVEELCEESYLGLRKTEALSPRGEGEPFGKERDGVVAGEAAALLMLEAESRVRERGVRPIAQIAGFGTAQDAYKINGYRVRGTGAREAMEQALEAAGIGADAVGCVISGASGSRAGDEMEALSLEALFGARLEGIPVAAPKAAWGECLGASGALSVLAGVLSLERQAVPPTAGFRETPFPLRLSAAPQPFESDYALVTACSCDGGSAALVLKRVR